MRQQMLNGAKVLLTGAAGNIGFSLGRHLAEHNEVWGLARFTDETALERVKAVGVVPHRCDLAVGDFRGLPDDFTHVLHLAATTAGDDYDHAITTNAEGTGLLLQHCRRAEAAMVMSTHSVYKPVEDPSHAFTETDPLGDANVPYQPTYSISKIGQEAVARFCSRAYDLPIVIARMNVAYGPSSHDGLIAIHMNAVASGQAVTTKWDPALYSPIYEDDINEQAAALLQAATVPANIVNWAGDDAVSVQQWVGYMDELSGRKTEVVVRTSAWHVARPGGRQLEATIDHRSMQSRLARGPAADMASPQRGVGRQS